MSFYPGVPYDGKRIEPNPTVLVEIRIDARVDKRESYAPQIESIYNFIVDQFPELQTGHMNSPIIVKVEIKE